MDLLPSYRPLILISLLCFLIMVQGDGSVFFLESPSHQYLRSRSTGALAETESMSLLEVGAAVSVLLGLAPSTSLTPATSLMLNKILIPNPFKRPHSVFMLEIRGAEGLTLDLDIALFKSSRRFEIISIPNKADIQLPDRDGVSVFTFHELLPMDSCENFDANEVFNLASWLGGSYVIDSSKPSNGVLSVHLASGVLKLHMSKNSHCKFVANLASLIRNIESAIKRHEDLSAGHSGLSELMIGCFDGIKALQEQHGHGGVSQQGMELLLTTVSNIFSSMQASYKGELVGVIFVNNESSPESKSSLNVAYTSGPSSRYLVESMDPSRAAIARALLVRRTIAWVTGIVVLIATLLGIYFLLYMPISKDSLLYSNVKLD